MLGINRRVGCWEKLVARHLVDERLRMRSRIEVAAIQDRISGREKLGGRRLVNEMDNDQLYWLYCYTRHQERHQPGCLACIQ